MARLYDHRAERRLIGSAFISMVSFDEIFQKVNAYDFHKPLHRELFDCMAYLKAKKRHVSGITVRDELLMRQNASDPNPAAMLLDFACAPWAFVDVTPDIEKLRRLTLVRASLTTERK